MLCQITIDGQPYSFPLEGEFSWGEDQVLFEDHSNLLAACPWREQGFSIFPLISTDEYALLQGRISVVLRQILAEAGLVVPLDFELGQYHRYVSSQALHQQAIEKTRFLTYADLGIDFEKMANRVSEFINHPLQLQNPLLPKEIVILRISLPHSLDINPLHRDGYLNLWEDVLNVWIPVAGCTAQSSLPVIPGSHYWNEKDVCRTQPKGASIQGLRYHVPGIVQARAGLHLIRPNPQPSEALLFTPFLVHGAAINQHTDTTRMALELRFYGGKQ